MEQIAILHPSACAVVLGAMAAARSSPELSAALGVCRHAWWTGRRVTDQALR